MLKSLQIKNYVLIDSLDVDFPEGLVIITGQTGAGKSILLGALSLLLGSKADASVIGSGADNCVVEAVFEVPESDTITWKLLRDNDLDDGSEELTIRRVVSSSGRSRSFVNDSPVSLQVLQGISSRLVDIHSQHQTLMLSDKSFQLLMLDHFAGNESLLSSCSSSFAHLRALERELSEVSRELSRIEEERDYIQSRWKRLDDANLKSGEIEALEEEQSVLANSESIKESFSEVEGLLDTSSLKEIRKLLEKAGKYVPEALSLADRVESARIEGVTIKKLGVLDSLEIGEEGFVAEIAASGGTRMVAATTDLSKGLSEGVYKFAIDNLPSVVDGLSVVADMLPDGAEIPVNAKGKITLAKAASLKYAKIKGTKPPEYELVRDTSKGKTNLSGLKLTYTAKTSTIKGSFAVYTDDPVKHKIKKTNFTVNGMVIDGKAVGVATCKTPQISCPFRIELDK